MPRQQQAKWTRYVHKVANCKGNDCLNGLKIHSCFDRQSFISLIPEANHDNVSLQRSSSGQLKFLQDVERSQWFLFRPLYFGDQSEWGVHKKLWTHRKLGQCNGEPNLDGSPSSLNLKFSPKKGCKNKKLFCVTIILCLQCSIFSCIFEAPFFKLQSKT